MGAPRFSIVTAVYNPPREAFEDTVASVLAQTEHDWEWILTDDCSPAEWVRPRLRELASADPRITLVERAENGGIVAASNDSLSRARGEFVALLDHDDTLAPTALATMVAAIERYQDVDYLYSDQDKLSADGTVTHTPFRKPDWSPERFRHHMYTTHFSVLRRALVEEVGGFRPGFDGSQDHDLVLRLTERARRVVHVPEVLYHWREVEGSVAVSGDAKPYAWEAGVRAIQDQLDRLGINATAKLGRGPGFYYVQREPDLTTPVSIIIPTIGASNIVWGKRRMLVVETIKSVIARSSHRAIEFVVVYDTPTPPEVLEALRTIEGATIKLIEFREKFNFSAKCNVGALHADGDVLVFLNDDMEAVSDGLVESLIAPLAEPDVGLTGAKLLFENLRIQHGGVFYGHGDVGHAYYKELHPQATGSHAELWINREASALTGACVAVRREVFDEVGGFTELLPANFNDVDFSFKIRRTGRRLLWLHDCVLFHFESLTREPTVHRWEVKTLTDRWGTFQTVKERYLNDPEETIRSSPLAWAQERRRRRNAERAKAEKLV